MAKADGFGLSFRPALQLQRFPQRVIVGFSLSRYRGNQLNHMCPVGLRAKTPERCPEMRVQVPHGVPEIMSRAVRIALLFEFGSLNGGEHSMLAIIDRTQTANVTYRAFAPSQGLLCAALQSRGISTTVFDVRSATGQRRPRQEVLSELHELLMASDCDLVHANSLSMSRLTGAIAPDLPMPTTGHLRDILKLSKAAIADLNRNRKLVAVSNATREFHLAQGMLPERVVPLYNGVDCERFQPRWSDGSLRRELNLSAEDFLILNVGQMGLRKGQDVLADAAVRLADELPQAKYLLAGQRCSGKAESREFERNTIATLEGIHGGQALRVLGYRDDMPRLMNAADVLVHAAHQEPLGRVLLEAGASGLPIIATNVGGTPEILRDGESALLVPADDSAALATAISRLARDEKLRVQLAQNARLRIVEKFPIAKAGDHLLQFWRAVIAESSRRL